jgi:hypothetical protein
MLIRRLAKKINLHGGGRNRGKNIFEISYEEESAQRVYQVVSILLNTMIEKLLKSSRTDTAVAQKFLNDQIREYEERLRLAEKKLAEFKKKNIGMMPDEKGGYYARLQSAQNKAESLITEVRLAQQRSAELHKQLRAENSTLSGTNEYPESINKLRIYQEQLKTLLAKYTENHPDVIVLQQTIRDLERKGNDKGSHADMKSVFNPVYQDLKIEATRADVEVEALKLRLAFPKRGYAFSPSRLVGAGLLPAPGGVNHGNRATTQGCPYSPYLAYVHNRVPQLHCPFFLTDEYNLLLFLLQYS